MKWGWGDHQDQSNLFPEAARLQARIQAGSTESKGSAIPPAQDAWPQLEVDRKRAERTQPSQACKLLQSSKGREHIKRDAPIDLVSPSNLNSAGGLSSSCALAWSLNPREQLGHSHEPPGWATLGRLQFS